MNPNDPLSWIEKGDRDLGVVKIVLAETKEYSDVVCYHCQQAAEKYLKALQLYFG
jgi:HEPN domain-containing protein